MEDLVARTDLQQEVIALRKRLTEEYKRGYRDAISNNQPHYIAQGSFGRITTLSLSNSVYKSTLLGDSANVLRLQHEFQL